MAGFIQGPTDSFIQEVFQKQHGLLTDVLKIALYDSTADLGPQTTAYTASGEVTGTGYSAGGATLSGATLGFRNGVVYFDFTDPTWASSSITARGALVYNASSSNKSVWVLNFGRDIVSSNTTFTVRFPSNDADSAVFRFGR